MPEYMSYIFNSNVAEVPPMSRIWLAYLLVYHLHRTAGRCSDAEIGVSSGSTMEPDTLVLLFLPETIVLTIQHCVRKLGEDR